MKCWAGRLEAGGWTRTQVLKCYLLPVSLQKSKGNQFWRCSSLDNISNSKASLQPLASRPQPPAQYFNISDFFETGTRCSKSKSSVFQTPASSPRALKRKQFRITKAMETWKNETWGPAYQHPSSSATPASSSRILENNMLGWRLEARG